MSLDMTRGKPLRLMVLFALPVLLSSALQQLYSMFDSVIVGRMLGESAFAAVGCCSYLNWFPFSMLIGLTQGFGVLFAQRFGAKDAQGYRRALATGVLIAALAGALLTVLGVCFVRPFLTLLKTPDALYADCLAYLRTMWCGLLITALYNVAGAALNSVGDSRTPLLALMLSTLINIGLDYLFLAAFRMGVEGAALATLISQFAALVLCVAKLRRYDFARPAKADWKPQRQTARELMRLGAPLLLSFSVISTGELAVQAAINLSGMAFVTGTTAARRYFALINIVGNALEAALATFVAQNAGAKLVKRVLEGTRTAVRLGVGSSAIITTLVIVFARPLIGVFLPNGDPQAVQIGVDALRVEACFLILLNMLCLHRAAIQGVGNSLIPMLSGFLELVLRLAAAFALPRLFGSHGLYYTDAFTWAGTALYLMGCYYFYIRRRLERGELLQ